MSELGVDQFHRFMRGKFADAIRKRYKSHEILCEADLQSFAWLEIRRFLRRNEERPNTFRILNKPFFDFKEYRIFPDLVVFKKKSPWVLIELKESKSLPGKVAVAEHDKLLLARGVLKKKPKRGYLVYVARYGDRRASLAQKAKVRTFSSRYRSF